MCVGGGLRMRAEEGTASVPVLAQTRVSKRAHLAAHRAAIMAAVMRAARAQIQCMNWAVEFRELLLKAGQRYDRGRSLRVPEAPQNLVPCVRCASAGWRRRCRRIMDLEYLRRSLVAGLMGAHGRCGYRRRWPTWRVRHRCWFRRRRLSLCQRLSNRLHRWHRHPSCWQRCSCSGGGSYSGGGA